MASEAPFGLCPFRVVEVEVHRQGQAEPLSPAKGDFLSRSQPYHLSHTPKAREKKVRCIQSMNSILGWISVVQM